MGRDVAVPVTDAARDLVSQFGGLVEGRAGEGDAIVLVRPDGYAAYSGNGGHGESALKHLRAILDR